MSPNVVRLPGNNRCAFMCLAEQVPDGPSRLQGERLGRPGVC
jgi:hypothetical protein